jgi:tRNA (guanine-N7-)-methyltransferase
VISPHSRPSSTSFIHPLDSILSPIDLNLLFPAQQPLEIELGCGDGTFLVHHASAHPHHNVLGVERFLGRLRKTDRKASRRNLTNLRLLRIEAAYFLEFLLPTHSVTTLHVYFPDPWPKRKHHKNRLVNDRFPSLAARILTPGGTVYLRTDDHDYFDQMSFVFASHSRFAPVETPPDLAARHTDFEREFLSAGILTLRAAYQLR